MKTNKEIGAIKRGLLKLLTKFQELSIKSRYTGLYYGLTKLHFYLYYGKNLTQEAVENSNEFGKAQKRHGNMVISILHPYSNRKKYLHEKAMQAFQKDLILKTNV